MDLGNEQLTTFATLIIGIFGGGWGLFKYFDSKIELKTEKLNNLVKDENDKHSSSQIKSEQDLRKEFNLQLENSAKDIKENKEHNVVLRNSLDSMRNDMQTRYVTKEDFKNELSGIKHDITRILDRQNDNRKEIEVRLDKLVAILLKNETNGEG